MKTFINILCALAGGAIAGLAAGFLVLMLPCSWFGSSFEGSCGYGAALTGILGGIAVAVVTGTGILLRRTGREPVPSGTSPSRKTVIAWWAAFVAQYLGFVPGIDIYLAGIMGTAFSLVGIAVLFGISTAIARARGMNQGVAWIALLPLIGPAIIAVLLFKPSSPKA